MSDNAHQFVGEIPANYDQGLGPNIFEPFAADIAVRAARRSPARVLELAAGTGIVSRKLRDALPAKAHLTVTDLNPPMLALAQAKFREAENATFVQADAMGLAFPDAHFDLIVCQFGVMFFPDKRASFREALRVLASGGAYLFSTWATMAENPFSQIAQKVSAAYFPDDPPSFYRVPFSYPDADIVAADLKSAGFTQIECTPVALQHPLHDLAAFARGIVYGNPLIDEIRKRGGADPDTIVAAVERRLSEAFGPAPTSMPLKANVFTARRA